MNGENSSNNYQNTNQEKSEYIPRDTEKNIKRPKELRVQSRENDFELE